MERRVRTLAVALLVLVALVGVGLALTGGVAVDGTIPLDDDDAPQVDVVTSNSEMLLDGEHGGTGTMEIVTEQGTIVFDGPDGTAAQVHEDDITGEYTSVTQIDAGSGLTITPEDKPAVTVGGGIDSVEFASMAVDDNTRDFTYTASSEASVTVNEIGATSETVVAVASDGTVLDQTTVDSSGSATFSELDSGSYNIQIATTSDPALSGAKPSSGTTVSETPVELSLNVSDGDFGAVQGDSVEVEFFDDSDNSSLGTDTLTSNGTATAEFSEPDGGENSWYAIVEDSYGHTVNTRDTNGGAFTFNAPSEMRIYSETEPDQLISQDVSLRVRFFIGESEQQVVERQATDGTVSLEGLPVDQRFIATVRANDTQEYTYRRIVVDSLIETQDVYLLNRSEPNSEIIYQLDDPTGEFPPEDTVLYVEKPITKDFDDDGEDETRYETIAGDVFGASAQFPVVLQQDTRYRLRVESEIGNSRILGAYSVTGDAVEPLQIQRVQLGGDADSGASLAATLEGEGQGRQIAIRYRDPAEETTAVEYRVVDQRTGEVYVDNTTREAQQFADFYNLPANASAEESFAVEYTIERADETRSGRVFAGDLPEIVDRFNVGDNVLRVISVVLILASMGLVAIYEPMLAPITGTSTASFLSIIGAFAAPNAVLGIAGAISVLVIIGGSRI